MNAEGRCGTIRSELSALLDDELETRERATVETHLEHCSGCRAAYERIERARAAIRLRSTEPVPDMTARILDAVRPGQMRRAKKDLWRGRIRTATLAAAASALFLFAASLPFDTDAPGTATAAEVARLVKTAARDVTGYRATFDIEERGWHPDVPLRRFTARVEFRPPEGFSLSITDRTEYPAEGTWPRNDIELRSEGDSWWLREPSSCPVQILPDCPAAVRIVERAVVNRQPFDGSTVLPTDAVIPLETVTAHPGFEVTTTRVMERDAVRISLPLREAQTLVRSFQSGGSWRSFDGTERVDMWLDRASWAPLRLVIASPTGSEPLLTIVATSLDAGAEIAGEIESGPAPPEGGQILDGGFRATEPNAVNGPEPAWVAGLEPHIAGRRGDGAEIRTYASGMSWLKVVMEPKRVSTVDPSMEVMDLGDRGVAYYLPAGRSLRRTLVVAGREASFRLESNLGREQLLRVARSLGVTGTAVDPPPGVTPLRTSTDLDRAHDVLEPTYLPPGYRFSAGYTAEEASAVVLHFRNPQLEIGPGIRITSSEAHRLTPSSEVFEPVSIHGIPGRWSPERGEVEWIDRGVYRAVAAPALDPSTVLRIARGLR